MGGSTTRNAIIKKYEACKECPNDISGYGTCRVGYENFYYRRGKNNLCSQCKTEITQKNSGRKESGFEDLSGKRFDMLYVIRFSGKTDHRTRKWECKCDCGTVKIVSEQTLMRDSFHSCGCYSRQFLTPGTQERCSKAGKERAKKRNRDGINIDMLDNSKNISTNTSGHKGISWSPDVRKWHVYIGYKSYRCTLAYVENFEVGIKLREAAYDAIQNGTFEDFFYELRGFRIEDRLKKQKKK